MKGIISVFGPLVWFLLLFLGTGFISAIICMISLILPAKIFNGDLNLAVSVTVAASIICGLVGAGLIHATYEVVMSNRSSQHS